MIGADSPLQALEFVLQYKSHIGTILNPLETYQHVIDKEGIKLNDLLRVAC